MVLQDKINCTKFKQVKYFEIKLNNMTFTSLIWIYNKFDKIQNKTDYCQFERVYHLTKYYMLYDEQWTHFK